MTDRLELLKKNFLFSSLSEENCKVIEKNLFEKRFSKGEYIFFEGDPSENLYIVKEGKVKIIKHSDTGKNVVLEVISKGEMFAQVAVFDGEPYPATAEAMENCEVMMIRRKEFFSLLEKHPVIATKVIGVLGKRLREAHDTIRYLAVERVERRIASLIVKMADKVGEKEKESIKLNINLTRQDIAEMVGTSVETAIRIMSRWSKENIIRSLGKKIVILDMDKLLELVEK
ncbi:MAG: hypothetical protein A2149_00965 [Candidatus Schekmanbacteria bacterium RBG_16_38_11]|uniref:Crp/Fnr family transcriptional regulator n=2 Tax=Candidatus Schekmaniibacteriota TaxID=1817811 RepID=A0A1F7RCX8_9BACT|nr:MAG: hypothetical protein A2042_01030 [Candidatus Schekmanbacteria bacterium GWA2_38_11]OGL47660.1 MAG: hypothetical protein A2149_00965 [Candidatus Schekmanbacteria bacterium RBG_16_38_11]